MVHVGASHIPAPNGVLNVKMAFIHSKNSTISVAPVANVTLAVQ